MDIGLYYRFTRLDTHKSVIVGRGIDDAPVQTGGGARWDVVNRPRMKSMTLWNGDDPYKMDVPVLFDGFDDNDSQESAIGILNQMKFSPSDYSPPPQVVIEGAVPIKGATWVVEDITWGTNIVWHPRGFRIRQDAVVHLLQYIAPDQLQIKAAATTIRYATKPGDTLAKIAKRYYGDSKLANVLKTMNNIRDPKKLPKYINIPPLVGK